jgi:hypothetical protein
MNKSMWNNEAVKAYESGQGVMMVKEPHPHYVPIPQHTWVELTDEEKDDFKWKWMNTNLYYANISEFIEAIETKLKEKNESKN